MNVAMAVGRAIILSRLDYCNALLCGVSEATKITRLQCLQNQLVRAVMKLPYRSHVSDTGVTLHWLPVWERITFKIAVQTFQAFNLHQPQYLSELLDNRIAALRSSSDTTQLVVPRTRNKKITRAYNCAAALVWNSLPPYMSKCTSLMTFKTHLKLFSLSNFTAEWYNIYQSSGRVYLSASSKN